MPLVRISLLKGKSPAYLRAVSEGVHEALVETYHVPADDRFQLIHQFDRDEMIFDADYLGIHRTEDLVMIDITASNWRGVERKKAFYAALSARLSRNPGLRTEDVLIVFSPNEREDWSFGNGRASYVDD